MKYAALAALGAAALTAGQPARAADIPVDVPAAVVVAASTWTGFYVGVGAGGRWSDTTWNTRCLAVSAVTSCAAGNAAFATRFPTANPSNFDTDTFRLSFYTGYNWQIASNWLIGAEADVAWGNGRASRVGIPGTFLPTAVGLNDIASVRDTWDGSLRLRAGILAAPNLLIYGTGGVAVTRLTATANCNTPLFPTGWCTAVRSSSSRENYVGWTIGGGAEWMLAPNWVLRGEYRYTDYGRENFTFFAGTPADQVDVSIRHRTHTAYAGISYLFAPPPAAVVEARY